MKNPATLATLGLLATASVAQHAASPAAAQRPQVPAIRTEITIVPIDVRVLDSNGRPVTDLKSADFAVFEDGERQEIKHFSASALIPEAPAPGAGPQFRKPGPPDLTPQNRRVLLIVLGRGRLQEPAKGTDALIGLVRERLLPQDFVAVLAYNRATDFTTDHQRVLGVLGRFKSRNNALESKLEAHFSGLQAAYGRPEIPQRIQADIDAVFKAPDASGYRTLPPGRIADDGKLTEDVRRGAAALLRAETIATRENALSEVVTDADFIGVPFDQFVFEAAQTRTDLENVYAGLEYLRHIDGEKHLLFVSERGLYLPALEHDKSLAAVASDARVAVHTIHTGGLDNPPSAYSRPPHRPFAASGFGPPSPQFAFRDRNASQSMANISRMTGGISSRYSRADGAVTRMLDATRFQYLLGYSPSNLNWNGKFRRISVRVNRPGVTVLYRHGYFGRDQLVPFNRQQYMAYSRIVTAGNYTGTIGDIPVTLNVVPPPSSPGEIELEITIDVSRVRFTRKDDLHYATLEIAFFCGDARQNVVSELWQTAELKLRDDTLAQVSSDGFHYKTRTPVKGAVRFVKAIVYDPTGDTLGSTVVSLK